MFQPNVYANDLKIVQHNVNTWTKKKESLHSKYRQIDPDIILINDHSLLDSNSPLKIQHYTVYTSNKRNEWHSGTAIAIKNTIKHTIQDDYLSDLLSVKIETRLGPVFIATDYIPPRVGFLNFPDYAKLLDTPHPVYILGDLNARHRILGNTNDNTTGKNIKLLIDRNKLKHIGPHFPTYFSTNSGSSPDRVFCNHKVYHNIHLSPGPATPSDHTPIVAKISLNPIQIPIPPRDQLSKADWPNFKKELENVQIPDNPHPDRNFIDKCIDDFDNKITAASKKHIPILKHRVIPGAKPNQSIKTLEVQLEAIYTNIRANGITPPIKQQINHLKNQLRNAYKASAKETWDTIVQNINLEDDPSKFFKSIKRFQGNDKQKAKYLKDEKNEIIQDPKKKEKLFREHWQNIFRNDLEDDIFDSANIEKVERRIFSHTPDVSPYSFGDLTRLNNEFPPITLTELKQIIKKRKQRAPGQTKITAAHLKHLPTNMLKYLLYIFNMSLSMGYFPKKYKHAIMIFIPKGSSSQCKVQNFRPISLLDVQAKLLDKILNSRLTQYLETNRHTNNKQHGFRSNRGTHTALALFHETLVNYKHVPHSKTDVVLRDVSKAFDKVWLNGLKFKLDNLKLHPCFLKILCNFLDDRTASIKIENYIGPPFRLLSGVPQGACLSPTLYSFFIHDMPPPAPHSDYIAYADDITQIISCPGKASMLAPKTSRAITQINNFENKWKIKTNVEKFTVIPMYRKNKSDIIIDNNKINYQKKGKILGLNFNTKGIIPQVAIRRNIALHNLSKLYRFKELSQPNKLKLYKSLVLSTLTYPTVPLNTISQTQMLKLQRVQNKGLRFVTNTSLIDRISSATLHETLNMKPINIIIHNQAKNTWEHIKNNLQDTYQTICDNAPLHQRYRTMPSSRFKAEHDNPLPLYV